MAVVPLVNTVLETVFIGKTSFVYFLGNVAFCGLYIYTLVMAIIDIVACIRSMKIWLLSKEDNKKNRVETRTVVIKLNNCITRYLILLMVSYMITAFNIGVMNTILLCLLIGGSLAVNIAKNIIYKGELVDSVVTALNRTIILLASLFLVFFSQLQTLDILNAFSRMGSAAEAGAFSGAFIGQIFCESVLKPAFYFITWICLLVVNQNINDASFENEGSVKKILIMDGIFLGIYMILLGLSNKYTDLLTYFNMIWRNFSLIAILAFSYISSMNVYSELKDIDYYGNPENTDNVDGSANAHNVENNSENTVKDSPYVNVPDNNNNFYNNDRRY